MRGELRFNELRRDGYTFYLDSENAVIAWETPAGQQYLVRGLDAQTAGHFLERGFQVARRTEMEAALAVLDEDGDPLRTEPSLN